MKLKLKQRLISGITALSIFASSLFPAVTVFSEEIASEEGAVLGTSADISDDAAAASSVTDNAADGEDAANVQAETAPSEEQTEDGADEFSCTGNTDISVSVRDGAYSLEDGTEVPASAVEFYAYEVNIDDQPYTLDIDCRVNVVKAYNTAWSCESRRVSPVSDDAVFTYSFTEDVPEEYAESVTVYTVQFGEWTAVETDVPYVDGGLVRSVSFGASLPDADMFAVSWTDPASATPDESILSGDRYYDFAVDGITAEATAFTGAVFTADEGNEYGAVPVNANDTTFVVDIPADDDERRAPFTTEGDETVRVYAPGFDSEKYDDVAVSDFSVKFTYALTTPVPEDKGYSCMAFEADGDGIKMIPCEKIIDHGYIKAITFTAKDVFAVYENISLKTLTASAEDEYTITLKYDKGAGIPDGAELRAVPMDADEFLADMSEALGWTDEDRILYTRLFDITIEKDGTEYEPLTPVTVTAELHDVEEVPEAMQIVHIDDEGAKEVEIGTSEGEQYTFETESFSVYGFGSALHTVIEDSTDVADIAVYTLNGSEVSADSIELDTPVEGVVIDRAYGLTANEAGKLWIKAEVNGNAELGEREKVSLYGVDNGIATRLILDDITAGEGLFAAPAGVTAIAVARDTGLRRQTLESRPDGEQSGKAVTLSGMMPVGAQASASDVTGGYMQAYVQYGLEEKPLAAYDISILEDTEDSIPVKYQPGEDSPVSVEITDPRIDGEDIRIYHITGDGMSEEITEFEASEGKLRFAAAGFSVYEVVKLPDNETEYEIAEITDEVSVTDFTAHTVTGSSEFEYDVVTPQIDDVGGVTVSITTVDDLEEYDLTSTGFYVKSNNANFWAKNSQENNVKDKGRTGIAVLQGITDFLQAYNGGAKQYYFEAVNASEHEYFIYCLADDGNTKLYVNRPTTGTDVNKKSLTLDEQSSTTWIVDDGGDGWLCIVDASGYNNSNKNGYHWCRQNAASNNKGIAAYSTNHTSDEGVRFTLYHYTPPAAITSDPCHLDYDTCGEKTYGLVSSNYALMAQCPNGSTTTLGASPALTPATNTDDEQCFTSPYGITGWKFHWIEGTATHKISAIADDGAEEKYLQITSGGLSLVDSYEDGSVFTITAGTNNTIKLTAADGSVNQNGSVFRNGAASEFFLVDLSDAGTDVLGLDGSPFGLVNAYDNNQGNALMCEYRAEKSNALANQAVWRTDDSFSFEGGITEWTFEHIDFNRYTLSAADKNGDTKYLKLQHESLTLSDDPFVLTLVNNGTDDSIKIVNTVQKPDIYNNRNASSFDYGNNALTNLSTTRWFTLVDVPEASASDPVGLGGKTYGIVNPNIDKGSITGGYAMMATSSLETKKLNYDSARNTYKLTNEFISGWTFHWTDHNNYTLSAKTDDGEKYLKFTFKGVSLVDEADATPVCIENGTGDNAGKIRIMPLLDGYLSVLYRGDNNFGRNATYAQLSYNRAWHDLVEIPVDDDPYGLDGLTYGLVYTADDVSGTALMADDMTTTVKLYRLVSHNKDDSSVTKILYVPQESDITEWTFANISEDSYTLCADTGKYLTVNGTELVLSDDEKDASKFTVVHKDGKIGLKCGGKYVTYTEGSGYGLSETAAGAVYLDLTEKTVLTENDNITYTADRISVSDGVNAKDGAELIVYTRIWNEKELRYDFYAIDHDGTMKQCYVSGDKLMWFDDAMNTLLWKLTVYHNADGSETGFYELQNEYSGKFLAPQLSGKLFSNQKVGLLFPGRIYEKNEDGSVNYGEYYTDITYWDDSSYDYAAIKGFPIKDKNNNITSVTLGATYLYATDKSFYFAVPQAVLDDEDTLHTVGTVDNNLHGISMKMVDFDVKDGKKQGDSDASSVTWDYFGGDKEDTKGLLSTALDETTGLPTVAKSNDSTQVGQSFDVFSSAQPVNHLFIQSIYDASGYFEFDSTQNTASFYDKEGAEHTSTDKDGNVYKDFTVYRELATHDQSNVNTRKHGQFFPYNRIIPGVYSKTNPQNLYDALAKSLDDSDPRKYEKLYHFVKADGTGGPDDAVGTMDYYFGMEMEADFVQTPSGLDPWGHDVIFEFTGDDDFWLYVDGELVIDLGGTHTAQGAKVNFKTGTVTTTIGDKITTKTLREVFTENYTNRHGQDGLDDYLSRFFDDGENMFKDYTTHTMKVFYMERGAGASNIHMRFNLSSVTEGNVLFSKSLTDMEGESIDSSAVDLSRLQFPFQIEWAMTEDDVDADNWTLLEQYSPTVENQYKSSVSYQNSTQTVRFAQTYVSYNNPDKTYQNVFFLVPGRSLEINFPDDAVYYRIRECAVDTDIYTVETSDEDPLGSTTLVGSIKDLYTESEQVKQQPTINFKNKIDPNMITSLDITKHLYTDKTKTTELTYEQDNTTFDYRLYISNGTGDELEAANLRSYYVLDPDGYLCRRNAYTDSFERFTVKNGDTYVPVAGDAVNILSETEKAQVTFHTSSYGAISKIPAGYTVRVPGLVAGTKFFVDEREKEIPTGYDLVDYKVEQDTENGSAATASYEPANSYVYKGETIALPAKKYNAAGTIKAGLRAKMSVNNCRGYGIKAEKQWSDSDFVDSHDTIYMAVYAGDELVEGTVRAFTNDDTFVKYFFETLLTGKTLADYKVYEVTLTSPVVAADGTVTYEGSPVRVMNGAITSIKVTDKGETGSKPDDYTVTYSAAAPANEYGNSYTETIRNDRKGGIRIRLNRWNDTDSDDEPLAGGTFELKCGETVVGEYTSDGTGIVTVLYGFEEGEIYTLTETKSPTGYIAAEKSISFTIEKEDTVFTLTHWTNGNDTDNDIDLTDGRSWAEYKLNDGVYTATIDIYNPEFVLKAIKVDSEKDDENNTIPLSGVKFALHRQVTTLMGTIMDTKPMTGYEELISGKDGVIDKINAKIPPGVYYLVETQALANYEAMSLEDAVQFRITDDGTVEMVREDQMDLLATKEGTYEITISIPNVRKDSNALLTITKTVEGGFGDRVKKFEFMLTVGDGLDTETEYEWTLNGVEQAKIKSGGTFKMRHGDIVELKLPADKITVTETSGDYDVTVSRYLTAEADDTTKRVTTQGSSCTFELEGDTTLDVTNSINGVVPTGVSLPEMSVFFAGTLALGAVLLAGRQRMLIADSGDDDSDD